MTTELNINARKEARTANRRLAQWRVTWLIEHSTSHQLLWCIDSFVLRNPPLRQAPKRYLQGYDTAYNDIPIITKACNNWSNPNTIQCHLLAGDCNEGNQPFILPFQTSIRKCVAHWNITKQAQSFVNPINQPKTSDINIVCIAA